MLVFLSAWAALKTSRCHTSETKDAEASNRWTLRHATPDRTEGGDSVESQNAMDELKSLAASTPCQDLRMHVDSTVGRGQTKLSVLGTEFNFDPRGESNAILRQVFIDLPLAMEHGSLRIEVHVELGTMRRSFPLLLRRSLFFACAADRVRLASLRHLNRSKRAIEI